MSICVDAHVHIYETGFWPDKWFDFVAEKWAYGHEDRHPKDIRPSIESGMADTEGLRLIEQMDLAGVDASVILNVDWELGMDGRARVPIDDIHSHFHDLVVRHPRRLHLFAGLDPRRPNALDLLTQAFDNHGARGLKLYPPVGFHPYDDVALPLYDACYERGFPVAIHTGSTLGLLRPRFGHPLSIQDVQRRLPGLKIWIAHAGAEWWWDEAVAVAKNGFETYIEVSGWQRLAYDDEREFVKRIGHALSAVGAERVLFGSDHISGSRVRGTESYLRWVDWFRGLSATARKYGIKVTPADVEAILGGNAVRCLDLAL